MSQVKLLKLNSGILTQATETSDSARFYSLGIGADAPAGASAISIGATPALSGNIRVANNTNIISSRNPSNTSDISILATDIDGYLFIGSDTSFSNQTKTAYISASELSQVIVGSNSIMTFNSSQAFTVHETNFGISGGSYREPTYGGGVGVVFFGKATTNPTTNPTDGIVAYVDSSDGYLKYRKTDGTIISLNGSGVGGGSFSAGGDLSGTSSSQQVISLTGSGGSLNVATTAATFLWNTGTSSPTIKQSNNTTASATAQTLTIQSQNATGTSSTGGDLTLTSGTGTSTNGYLNLQVGGTNIARCFTDKFITSAGRRIKTNVQTSNYSVAASDEIIVIGSITGTITITLPSSPTAGDIYTIKDQGGNAGNYGIIISGNGNNIDGSSTYTMNSNYQSVNVIYANSSWNII